MAPDQAAPSRPVVQPAQTPPPVAPSVGLGRVAPSATPDADVELTKPATGEDAYRRTSTEQGTREDDLSLPEVLDAMMELKASDLHLSANSHPAVRVNGDLRQLTDFPMLDAGMIQRTMYGAITQVQRERFEEDLELDFSYTLPGRGRFRVNMYKQKDAVGAAFRLIPIEIKSLETLGIPAAVREFSSLARGFVLVTGPTGSG